MKHESLLLALGLSFIVIAISVILDGLFSSFSIRQFLPNNEVTISLLFGMMSSIIAAIILLYYSRLNIEKKKSKRIFIIFSRADRDDVSEIVRKLKELGYNPWYECIDILPGQFRSESIKSAISSSAVAIYVVSKNTYNDPYSKKELEMVRNELHMQDTSFSPVIPVTINGAEIPEELKDVQYVEMRDSNAFVLLEKSLKIFLDVR